MQTNESQSPEADPILGRSVGKYRVEKRLGAGGMGSVYLLRHMDARLANAVQAMKVMAGGAQGETLRLRMRERFDQEMVIADAVGGHRVVKPIDVGEFEDGTPYYMMEYVPGRSLDEELAERGPLPVATALRIAYRVADTMALVHEKGFVHRDLKPANIMLVAEGGKDFLVKLLDFGVARASGELKVAHTVEGMIVGTPGYMPKEAFSTAAVDGRADVFALGVIVFQMLSGELPFAAPTVEAAMTNVVAGQPEPLRRPPRLDPVPPEVAALVARAIAREKEQRPTMSELRAALAVALGRIEGAQGTGEPMLSRVMEKASDSHEHPTVVSSRHQPRTDVVLPTGARSRRGVVLAAAGLLSAAVIAVVVGSGRKQSRAPEAHPVPPPATASEREPPRPPVAPPAVTPLAPAMVRVVVMSDPPADLYVGKDRRGRAPQPIPVTKGAKVEVRAEAKGYLPATATLDGTKEIVEIKLKKRKSSEIW